jgi:hypothetical protein
VGSRFISEAAKLFVAMHPPRTPCIAEYGEDFPVFLATCRGADRVPYLREFSRLEWHIGHVAIAVDEPVLGTEELSTIVPEVLPDTALALRSGVRYLHASWPVDELMKVYLAETAPERLEFGPAEVWLEIRGVRAEFHMNRLELSEFIFRESILKGQPDIMQCSAFAASGPVSGAAAGRTHCRKETHLPSRRAGSKALPATLVVRSRRD